MKPKPLTMRDPRKHAIRLAIQDKTVGAANKVNMMRNNGDGTFSGHAMTFNKYRGYYDALGWVTVTADEVARFEQHIEPAFQAG